MQVINILSFQTLFIFNLNFLSQLSENAELIYLVIQYWKIESNTNIGKGIVIP